MGMVGDHTYSTIRTPYCSAAAEASSQKHALEEVPELRVYLFYNSALVWKDDCASLFPRLCSFLQVNQSTAVSVSKK